MSKIGLSTIKNTRKIYKKVPPLHLSCYMPHSIIFNKAIPLTKTNGTSARHVSRFPLYLMRTFIASAAKVNLSHPRSTTSINGAPVYGKAGVYITQKNLPPPLDHFLNFFPVFLQAFLVGHMANIKPLNKMRIFSPNSSAPPFFFFLPFPHSPL